MSYVPQGLARHDKCRELVAEARAEHDAAVEAAVKSRREARGILAVTACTRHDATREALRIERYRHHRDHDEIARLEAIIAEPIPAPDYSAIDAEYERACAAASETFRRKHAEARRRRDAGELG